jgi:hypothetical protein
MNNETAIETNQAAAQAVSGNATLFDMEDGNFDNLDSKESEKQESKEAGGQSKEAEQQMPSEWYYENKIKGEGVPPEWFNHKTFKTIADQAKAYVEARRQIAQYSEKLKGFSGAPEDYEVGDNNKDDLFVTGLKELGKKIDLNQTGFNELLGVYKKTHEVEQERKNNELLQARKEELKKIGGTTKLKELEAKFINTFGNVPVEWLKSSIKSYDDYKCFEQIIDNVSGKTRLPVNSAESTITTREQAEALIRDPRWGKDKEFTDKANKIFGYMIENKR